MVQNYYLISDAAKLVKVESHVLRYWEEELKLPIKRNELGHRYYTQQDVDRFREIKELKEQGLQLKAIRLFLKDGKLTVEHNDEPSIKIDDKKQAELPATVTDYDVLNKDKGFNSAEKDDKVRRLQWLLQQMIANTLRENNQELCDNIRDSIVKELDYQFRMQEQKVDEREKEKMEREEEYYQKLDELLRIRSQRKWRKDKEEKTEKRKRHSLF